MWASVPNFADLLLPVGTDDQTKPGENLQRFSGNEAGS